MLALGPWLVRLADTGPVSSGFWRMFLALPFLIVLARLNYQPMTGFGRKTMLLVALGSVAFAMDLASWHTGIEMTRLGNATLFGNAGSIILLFWGFILAHKTPSPKEAMAIAMALGGASILLGRSLEISTQTAIGDLFCLLAGLCYAVYLLTIQDARQKMGGWSLLAWVSIFGSPMLLGLAVMNGEPFWPQNWTPILVLVLTSQLMGQGLLVFSMRYFSPLMIGLGLLTQPAISAAMGYLAFGETLNWVDLIGMALLGGALLVAKMTQESKP